MIPDREIAAERVGPWFRRLARFGLAPAGAEIAGAFAIRMSSTIKDVAAAAGVHFATVSRALRGDPRISTTTVARVRAAAAKLGYRRTAENLALSARRHLGGLDLPTERIALVCNRSPENGYRWFVHYRLIERGARLLAAELGYECELLHVDRGHHDSRSLGRYLAAAGIRGIVFMNIEVERRQVDLPWSEFSAVKIDSEKVLPAFTSLAVDQFGTTLLAFRRMQALGYRRIGLAVSGDGEVTSGGLSTAASLLAQAALPAAEQVAPFYFSERLTNKAVGRLIGPWLEREQIDAVISHRTQVRTYAHGRACATTCMHTPVPGLAGVMVDFRQVGRQAVALLVSQLRSGQFGVPATATRTYFQGEWRDGGSARRCGLTVANGGGA
jgi:LacI family transcriptional regulator